MLSGLSAYYTQDLTVIIIALIKIKFIIFKNVYLSVQVWLGDYRNKFVLAVFHIRTLPFHSFFISIYTFQVNVDEDAKRETPGATSSLGDTREGLLVRLDFVFRSKGCTTAARYRFTNEE